MMTQFLEKFVNTPRTWFLGIIFFVTALAAAMPPVASADNGSSGALAQPTTPAQHLNAAQIEPVFNYPLAQPTTPAQHLSVDLIEPCTCNIQIQVQLGDYSLRVPKSRPSSSFYMAAKMVAAPSASFLSSQANGFKSSIDVSLYPAHYAGYQPGRSAHVGQVANNRVSSLTEYSSYQAVHPNDQLKLRQVSEAQSRVLGMLRSAWFLWGR
jgi:hypothetical protein